MKFNRAKCGPFPISKSLEFLGKYQANLFKLKNQFMEI
jgi:hypothetical protein